jgi:histidyl-tRNA synthetase
MKKQMEYANRRGVPYVAILGSDELAAGTVTVKNMGSGEQQSIAQAELINLLK